MLHMMTSSKNADISKNCFCIFAVTIREGTYPENFTHIALLVLDSPTPSPHERGAPKNAMSNRVNNKSIQCKRLFFVKDSFSREVTNFHVSLYMASLDVKSLPTNILSQETISNAVQDLFHVHHYRGNLSKDDLKSLLSMATTQSIFVFNDQLYRQVDGV